MCKDLIDIHFFEKCLYLKKLMLDVLYQRYLKTRRYGSGNGMFCLRLENGMFLFFFLDQFLCLFSAHGVVLAPHMLVVLYC